MRPGERYWQAIEPICDEINIYDGPDVFLSSLSRVRPELGFLYAAHFCQSEVCNGGFDQFFSNSTGVLALEAVRGFRIVGMTDLADIVERAMAFFDSPYPRERGIRSRALSGATGTTFDALNEEFFKALKEEKGGWESAADSYAAQLAG